MGPPRKDTLITLRLETELVNRADALVDPLKQGDFQAVRMSRSAVLRIALLRGLRELEQEHGFEPNTDLVPKRLEPVPAPEREFRIESTVPVVPSAEPGREEPQKPVSRDSKPSLVPGELGYGRKHDGRRKVHMAGILFPTIPSCRGKRGEVSEDWQEVTCRDCLDLKPELISTTEPNDLLRAAGFVETTRTVPDVGVWYDYSPPDGHTQAELLRAAKLEVTRRAEPTVPDRVERKRTRRPRSAVDRALG